MEVIVTSPWVPREWIQAHGLEPRGVWLRQHHQPAAVAEGVCAFAQEMASLAKDLAKVMVIQEMRLAKNIMRPKSRWKSWRH